MNQPRKIVLFTLLTIFCAMWVAGCQSTPDTDVVVMKESGIPAAQAPNVTEAPSDYTFEAPQRYKSNLDTSNGSEIVIDADVVVTGDVFPTLRVAPAPFTEEQASWMVSALFSGTPNRTKSLANATKSEIEAKIVELKKGGTDLQDKDPAAYEELIADEVAALEEQYKTAPEEYVPVEFDGTFLPQPYETAMEFAPYRLIIGDNVETIDVSGPGKDGREARLIIERDAYGHAALDYTRGEILFTAPGDSAIEPVEVAQNLPAMQLETAQKKAEEVVDSMGLSDYAVADVGSGLAGPFPEGDLDNLTYDDYPKCYVFQFTRKNGLLVNYVSNEVRGDDYAEPREYEKLTVCVDDIGISRIEMKSPLQITEREKENIELMSFNTAAQRIEENLLRKFGNSDESIDHISLTIDRVQLGLVRISQNEDMSDCRLVPGWDVYGKLEVTYTDGTANDRYILGESHLTMNAADGSLIDRKKGY